MEIPKAIIRNDEVRCPVCNRKHLQLKGNERIENLEIYCRGRRADEKHSFLVNFKREVNKNE